jgi:AcrR family transcriptional regulator
VCTRGLAEASARTIAATAGVNQALVFYHFGSVSSLIEAASNQAVDDAIAHHQSSLDGASTLADLAAVGRALQDRERQIGNVTFMAQILSGASHDAVLAQAAGYAIASWTDRVSATLRRVLDGNPIASLIDIDGLAHVITAAIIGLELCAGTDPSGSVRADHTIATIADLVDAIGELPPIATRTLTKAARKRVAS